MYIDRICLWNLAMDISLDRGGDGRREGGGGVDDTKKKTSIKVKVKWRGDSVLDAMSHVELHRLCLSMCKSGDVLCVT